MPSVSDLKLLSSGKVREIYEWDDDLLMVASDRISTYDVVMPTPIPDKGKVLNRMSVFWFGLTEDIVPNHFISEDVPEDVAERAMRVRKLEMYPVECIVRGYLTGSGWKEYKRGRHGLRDRAAARACSSPTSCGSRSSPPRPRPRSATTTRTSTSTAPPRSSATGRCWRSCTRVSIEVYRRGAEQAAKHGIILADTKFEFGRAPAPRSSSATRC